MIQYIKIQLSEIRLKDFKQEQKLAELAVNLV